MCIRDRAARVLREYAYFSPELKAILEKAALMQADRSRTGGMFHGPKSSQWGEVQNCETLCPGVFLVSNASHGGTTVSYTHLDVYKRQLLHYQ